MWSVTDLFGSALPWICGVGEQLLVSGSEQEVMSRRSDPPKETETGLLAPAVRLASATEANTRGLSNPRRYRSQQVQADHSEHDPSREVSVRDVADIGTGSTAPGWPNYTRQRRVADPG